MSADVIPGQLDLRHQGWDLADRDADDGASITIIDAGQLDSARRLQLLSVTRPEERRMMLVGSANTAGAGHTGWRTALARRWAMRPRWRN